MTSIWMEIRTQTFPGDKTVVANKSVVYSQAYRLRYTSFDILGVDMLTCEIDLPRDL